MNIRLRVFNLAVLFSCVFSFPGLSQNLTCNNWVNIPSWQSFVSVGDLDIPGNTVTVEAVFRRTAPYSNGFNWAGNLVSNMVTITESTCNESATLSRQVVVNPLPLIKASKSNDLDCSNDKSQLTATGAARYSWSPAISLNNASSSKPVATPTITTLYEVTEMDNRGCSNTDTVTVKVDNTNKGGYLMPTGFTPNNDGLNDCYGVKYWGVIEQIEFSIFNRRGERIFYTTDPRKCWDGTYRGVKLDAGVFVYMIKANTNCEAPVFRKGTFALIR